MNSLSSLLRNRASRVLALAIFTLLIAGMGCESPSGDSLEMRSESLSTVAITQAGDELRTGWYDNQPRLSPAIVSGPTFGKLFTTKIDGQVYAQPLVSNDIVLVVTETNHIYGLDSENGAPIWERTLAKPFNAADVSCVDLYPSVGVTGTPVIDRVTNTAYFFSKTYENGQNGLARWNAHAIDMETGAERPGFPVKISGNAQNEPSTAFPPGTSLQRPGLLLLDGVVYGTFGGHCDRNPFHGWIAGVTTTGQLKTLWVTQQGPDKAYGGGIWQSGTAPMSDGPGQIIFTTGNGGSPKGPIPGKTPPGALGQMVVRTTVAGDGSMRATDFFAPYDARALDGWDADLGASAPVGLPEKYFGTPAYPRLLVQSGKQGYVYLLNRDDLGGIGNGANGGDQVIQRIGPYGGVWSQAAVWPGDGGWVYIPTASGGNTPTGGSGNLRMYKYGVDGAGKPTLSLAATSSDPFGFGTGGPVVTSVGTGSGSALLWIIWSPDGSGGGAQLRAYDTVPVNGEPKLRFKAPIGQFAKFTLPGIGNGRVYVATRDGQVHGFGAPLTAPINGAGADFGSVVRGQTKTQTVRVTANEALTITGLTSTSGEFTVGAVALPAQLAQGQGLDIPLSFKPNGTGMRAGAIDVATTAGPASIALTGIGLSETAELAAAPPVVSFGGVATGATVTGTVTFSNTGGAPLTISAVQLPTAPFSVTGTPAVGGTVAAGASLILTVSFAPTTIGEFTSSVALTTSAGKVTVPLSGTASPPGNLTVSRTTIAFGEVPVGSTRTAAFTLTNKGGSALTLLKSKPPAQGQFSAITPLPEGTVVQPGTSRTFVVSYAPKAAGTHRDTWELNTNDASGLRSIQLEGTAVASGPEDLTSAGSIIALITQPNGGGSRNLEVIRDKVLPAIDSTDSGQQYDTYTGGKRGEDWIGYSFASARRFGSVLFQEGKQFEDGGWFTSLKVQVRRGGVWTDVDAEDVKLSPAYLGGNNVGYETHLLSFPAEEGDGIRLFGNPGGSATFISVGELRVFGPSASTPPPTGNADKDVSTLGSIIALITAPKGGGTRSLEVIRDGVRPALNSSESLQQYDTYTGVTRTADWIGYQFPSAQRFRGLSFTEGKQFWDGGWFSTLKAQVRSGGTWNDVAGLTVTPSYAGRNGTNYDRYELRFTEIAGDGIRLYGTPGGSATFISVAELRVLAAP